MRFWLAIVVFVSFGWGQASAACIGSPYDQFDFWLGVWHDPATSAAERYSVRRTAAGCAIEEVLVGADGQVAGMGLSGWDGEQKHWRQLWVDADKVVKLYTGGPAADGTFVLTSEAREGGVRWRYTYRNIRSASVDADYARSDRENGPWVPVWSGHYDRTPADEK